ncbi:ASKHA domain-containing protein [Desulfurivibrio alkaliphilus]|uniref:Ferredoxin n=1 Tax=Desulfurivibrio alkaliphilus (strain DSM 19089 / UNIQEM U267 / AHT2) TaxID=589865 RepID=D6Z535_DESAT|nr:ASKHA domain-containing protein [Desulfurivibrio alkaliphilus]ADH86660.1 ferredoxin [Desulfurivibrio alkaliphilus AHT 2]
MKTIQFLPDNVSIEVEEGENLLAAAARAGVYVNAYCGGDGVCGKCKVAVESGEVESGKARLKNDDYAAGLRLACQSRVKSDLVVRIPEAMGKDGKALKRKPAATRTISARSLDQLIGDWHLDPPVEKRFLKLDPPTMENNIPDLQRLMRAIRQDCHDCKEPTFDHPDLLKELPFTLREAGWQVTVILLKGRRAEEPARIIAVEPGDTTASLYGLAVDIGTTTVCGMLVDLNSGKIIAEASAYNDQISCGEDVISRIVYSQRGDGLRTLQGKVVRTINNIIETLCKTVIISPSDISYIMAAGNTIMSHLLLGLDPKFIREAPYVPTCSHFPLTKAAELGVLAHPSVRLFLYPAVASYVGGDIIAGVHACRMYKSPELTLFIDIGTNGEIVVGNEEWMVCAACSAGPAFEGGGIRHGMRANSGAIENFHIHPETLEPMIITIDRIKPCGICGSGLIAIVAELLNAGVIDPQGKFNRSLEHHRIRQGEDGWEYVLAWGKDALLGQDVAISEVDLDNLIRAKGAMYAGYQTLLESVGMDFADLDRVILAGNFGAYIDLERAITIGLLPDIPRERFFYLGNGSLLGCRVSLSDNQRFRERMLVSELVTNLELAENAQFMDHYMAALFLPHTNLSLFPTVAKTR